jgi:hypothetical protein
MAHSSVPACVMRRSGEILKCNRTFRNLVGLSTEKLLDQRFFELLSEEACVNFWERIIPLYNNTESGALVTMLIFRIDLGDEEVECLASMSVKYDSYQMPVLVVATLIPA